jgi:hypothetical protein
MITTNQLLILPVAKTTTIYNNKNNEVPKSFISTTHTALSSRSVIQNTAGNSFSGCSDTSDDGNDVVGEDSDSYQLKNNSQILNQKYALIAYNMQNIETLTANIIICETKGPYHSAKALNVFEIHERNEKVQMNQIKLK